MAHEQFGCVLPADCRIGMNNPLRILQAVDAKLDQPVEFFLFGRAALVPGFADPPPEASATYDVDGIIPRDLASTTSGGWP